MQRPRPRPRPPSSLSAYSTSPPPRRAVSESNLKTQTPTSARSSRSAPPPSKVTSHCHRHLWTKLLRSLFSLSRTSEFSTNSDLTEENLQEHNRRQAIIDGPNSKRSPSNKGLTDSSLVISRRRLSMSTPGRESLATTVRTSSPTSTFMEKMGELSSCFDSGNNSKRTEKDDHQRRHAYYSSAASPRKTKTTATTLKKEMKMDGPKRVSFNVGDDIISVENKKPLRERVSVEDQAAESDTTTMTMTTTPSTTVLSSSCDVLSSEEAKKSSSTPTPTPVSVDAELLKGSILSNDRLLEVGVAERRDHEQPVCNNDGVLVEKEYVWAAKYRPKDLTDFICNRGKAISLQGLIKHGDCGHFIFEGPPGVGKRTMIWAMLREAFGPEKVQPREKRKIFELKGEARGTVEILMKESSHHIEVSLSELKGYEKHVIVELIKETHNRLSKKAAPQTLDNSRAIILYEADRLSSDALLYIRWLLERYKHAQVFFCCSDASKLQPIKKLCSVVHLSLPSKEEVVEMLEFVAGQEGIILPRRLAERIAENSKNNLRQAIRSLEASWQKSYPFTEDQPIVTGWEDVIAMIAKEMTQEQSPKQLFIISGKLQTLSEHDVTPKYIIERLILELKKLLDESLQDQVMCFYQKTDDKREDKFSDTVKENDCKTFMQIEEFIARFMSSYKLSLKPNKNDADRQVHHFGIA